MSITLPTLGPGRVLVVGDVMTDIIVRPHGEMVRGSDRNADIASSQGGSAANQAAWLAHLDVPVALFARVGASDVAAICGELETDGIASLLRGDAARETGRIVTLVDPDGERSFFTDGGANRALDAADLPDGWLADTSLLVLSGYTFFAERPREAALTMLAAARRAGVPVVVDPASTGFLSEVGVEAFLDWTAGSDFIIPNAEEAALLTGSSDLDVQLEALSARYPFTVIKCGASGAAGKAKGSPRLTVDATLVDAIDTTGAGDAFLAGFIARWRKDADLASCMSAGAVAGATAVQHVGGRPRRGA